VVKRALTHGAARASAARHLLIAARLCDEFQRAKKTFTNSRAFADFLLTIFLSRGRYSHVVTAML